MKNLTRSNYLASVLGGFLTLLAIESKAFKVETHIWIAQQVINDLARQTNGSISFQIGDQTKIVTVPTHVRDAILQHPEAYRMGHVGPDAFPGIFEGQMTIHPGLKRGWGTGEWLEHALRSAKTGEEIAFAYGMIGHAAADVWAHSYVNHYAGDEYSVKGENEVEARHFILEGFIASHMPPLTAADSRPLKPVYELIKKGDRYAIPEDFLFRIFVEDAEAAEQFRKSGSVHIAAVHTLNKNLLHLARNDGPTDQLHRFIQDIIIQRAFNYDASTEELRMLNEAHQRLLDLGNETIDQLQKAHGRYRALVRKSIVKTHREVEKSLELADENVQNAVTLARALANEKNKVEAKIQSTEDDVIRLGRKLARLADPFTRKRLEKRLKELKKGLQVLRNKKKGLESSALTSVTNSVHHFRKQVSEAHKSIEALYDAELKTTKALIDLAQRFNTNENPIKNTFLEWVNENEKAMKAYFIANAEAIENSMRGRSMSAPLTNWAKCEALTFAGVPRDGLRAGCSVFDALDQIKNLLEIAKKFDPILARVKELRIEIETNVLDYAKGEALGYADAILNTDMTTLLESLEEKPTRANLDRRFATAPGSIALIKITNVASRVDLDMALDASGHFNPNEFAAIYNALVLVRLSLLGAESLNQVAGTNAFSSADFVSNNIMMRFTRSIDGDYQWMNRVPPYARAQGNHKEHGPYTYGSGFPFWKDSAMRTNVFTKLFKGPLNKGLYEPTNTLPDGYPFRPDTNNPFPNYPDNGVEK